MPARGEPFLTVGDIYRRVESGTLALPEFQRDYIWKPGKVAGLLSSIFLGWPIGMLLLMEAPPDNFFAVRGIEGAPRPKTQDVKHLILDGQQRTTAIYQAFKWHPGRIWVLDTERFLEGIGHREIDEAFSQQSAARNRETDVMSLPKYIPLHVLRAEEEFFHWRNSVLRGMKDPMGAYETLTGLWIDHLSRATTQGLPSVVLPKSMPLADVATIFERLNTAGVALDTFDLVVAHMYRDGVDLKARWRADMERYPALRAMAENDPLIAVEIVALLTRGDTRRESLLSLNPGEVWDSWSSVIAGLNEAAEFLIREGGVPSRQELPHRALFLVLASVAVNSGLEGQTAPILTWFFTSAFSDRYDRAVNTREWADFRDLRRALNGEDSLPLPRLSTVDLTLATRRGSSTVYAAVLAMIRRGGLVDAPFDMLRVPQPPLINPDLTSDVAVPTSILIPDPSARPGSECALSYILVSAFAKRKLDGIGAVEFGQRLRVADPDEVRDFLESQSLPPLGPAYRSDDAFLVARAELMQARLHDLRGDSASGVLSHDSRPAEGRADVAALRERFDQFMDRAEHASGDPYLALEAGKDYIVALRQAGRLEDAVRTLELLEAHARKEVGPRNLEAADLMRQLAFAYGDLQRPLEAWNAMESYLEVLGSALGRDSSEVSAARLGSVELALKIGRLDWAEAELDELVPLLMDSFGSGSREVLTANYLLAEVYEILGRGADALALAGHVAIEAAKRGQTQIEDAARSLLVGGGNRGGDLQRGSQTPRLWPDWPQEADRRADGASSGGPL